MAKKERKVKAEVEEKTYVMDVTRSYARKLNLSQHGGAQFETVDLYESRTAKDVPGEEVGAVSRRLYEDCQASINASVKAYDEKALSEMSTEEKPTKEKRKLTKTETTEDKIGIEKEELEEIAPHVQKIVAATSVAEFKEVQESIKAHEGLNENQLNYLRALYKKHAAAIRKANRKAKD